MRRRELIRTVPAIGTAGLVGLAGCAASLRPAVRTDAGFATIHPGSEIVIADGLTPGGSDELFVTAATDEAPELLGPDADTTVRDLLGNPGIDQFHVVYQTRARSGLPVRIWPESGSAFDWPSYSALRVTVTVDPWGSLPSMDEDQRTRLEAADELVVTGIWSLEPRVDPVPDEVELRLADA